MARKRAHGEGSLRQRPNGIWELTLMVGFQSDGRRKYKSFYAKTQKEVKEKAKAYQSAKAEGLDVDTVYYFADWADMWFENHKDNICLADGIAGGIHDDFYHRVCDHL